jgi:choline dehydrogenase-like flavoprotein
MTDTTAAKVDVLVIGSGAGGAVTALELASAGRNVVVIEEGDRHRLGAYGTDALVAMERLYRRRGMTPIIGRVPIGYVEGRCVGGSTEINSGFWHRTPRDVLLRWKSQFDLADASAAELEPHFAWAENALGVGLSQRPWPPSTEVLARGANAMGWSAQEVPRAARGCQGNNTCANGCPNGAKQGMSVSLIPAAERAGAKVLTGCRVNLLLRRGARITGVLVETSEGAERQLMRIDADHVFVCAGPTETPSLLRRSGIKYRVGDSLRIHPMLKVAARFKDPLEAERDVLPLLQIKDFSPDMHMGGAFFSKGHLAMTLNDNWNALHGRMADSSCMATYYVAVRGRGRGSVRPSVWGESETTLRYELADEDLWNLSRGLARLAALLLAAGAIEVYPSVTGLPMITRELDAIRWMDERLTPSALSLTTVHAFSSCPIGERLDRTVADSYGRVRAMDNLYINDASTLPDSPGVNPQGSVMALARRNTLRFLDRAS